MAAEKKTAVTHLFRVIIDKPIWGLIGDSCEVGVVSLTVGTDQLTWPSMCHFTWKYSLHDSNQTSLAAWQTEKTKRQVLALLHSRVPK